jgi:hypothetical protein
VARIKELERSLAVATRAPVEAASLIAQAQAVRARLDELRSALASNRAELRRDFYRRVLTGLTFRAENDGRRTCLGTLSGGRLRATRGRVHRGSGSRRSRGGVAGAAPASGRVRGRAQLPRHCPRAPPAGARSRSCVRGELDPLRSHLPRDGYDGAHGAAGGQEEAAGTARVHGGVQGRSRAAGAGRGKTVWQVGRDQDLAQSVVLPCAAE